MDVFLYNGVLARGDDLKFIDFVAAEQKGAEAIVVLVTFGGDPDAAYKIGRYLQSRYQRFSVLVPGLCKSAGTLLAIAANELIFTPYGELGPLDIQLTKTDRVAQMESGLNIQQAFATLENRASNAFQSLVAEIVSNTGGVISYQTASHSAAELVSALYAPIFGRIDPEEVGSRTRSMQIGNHYGDRLNARYQNLKEGAVQYLVQTFPSHGFVIDYEEACEIFERVREAAQAEKKLVEHLGSRARFQGTSLDIACLTDTYAKIQLESDNVEPSEQREEESDGAPSAVQPQVDGRGSAATVPGSRERPNGVEAAVGQDQPN